MSFQNIYLSIAIILNLAFNVFQDVLERSSTFWYAAAPTLHRISFNSFSDSFIMVIDNKLAKCALLSLFEVTFQLAIQCRLVSNQSCANLTRDKKISLWKTSII